MKDSTKGIDFTKLSDDRLYNCFTSKVWNSLDESSKEQLVSEVVARENISHGFPVNVSFKEMDANTEGLQYANNIDLNREVFVNGKMSVEYDGKTIEYEVKDSGWRCLEASLHENRHVFQELVSENIVETDEETKALFTSNNFTVSDIEGNRASQYMLGKDNYSLYFLNPTELDAFKTSQDKTVSIINDLKARGIEDPSMDIYLSNLEKSGYQAELQSIREAYSNPNIDKDVAVTLQNVYYGTDNPVDPSVDQMVKDEMIYSQTIIDNEAGLSFGEENSTDSFSSGTQLSNEADGASESSFFSVDPSYSYDAVSFSCEGADISSADLSACTVGVTSAVTGTDNSSDNSSSNEADNDNELD